MKTALYLRVSSKEQKEENQLPALEDYARRKEWLISEIYREQATAWRDGHQSELARLLRDARRGRFSYLLVWSLDRLSRQGSEAILGLVHRLSNYGVKVISLKESWTEAPGELGELLFAVVGWVARMESQRRSERTRAGLERVRKAGKLIGRPPGSKDRRKRSAPKRRALPISEWSE